jgi:F-type H+-transporting ATPase subunit epsilon
MADQTAQKVSFELVSPERLLFAASVDMVVVPGVEGDFGVLPGHSLFVSGVRPGVIDVHDKGAITDRIFVAGGFAEATPERCTILADEALPVSDLKRDEIEARIRDGREDVEDAKDDKSRRAAEKRLAVAEAMLAACPA